MREETLSMAHTRGGGGGQGGIENSEKPLTCVLLPAYTVRPAGNHQHQDVHYSSTSSPEEST